MRKMAETCEDLSDLTVEEELSRDVESLKAILESDGGLNAEDHTRGVKNFNSGDNGASSYEEQHASAAPLEQLLTLNENLQQSLRKQLEDINEALRRNREHQTRLGTLTTLSKAKLIANSFTLKVFTRSHSYFFQKAQDQPSLFKEEGSGTYFTSRELPWNVVQEKKLMNGLRRQAMDLRIHQLRASDGSQSVKKLNDEIKAISCLSDEELLADTSEVNWEVIALEEFDNRRLSTDLKLHWQNHLHFGINHSSWDKEEDKQLLRLGKESDYRNWAAIATGLKTNRTPFQCLQRYQQYLNPDMTNSYTRWTEQEDQALLAAVAKVGQNWAAVSAHIGTNRSSQQCLHRWRYSLAPGKKKGRWGKEEDEALRGAVELCGVGHWSRIATVVGSRNSIQCRERWVNVLDSSIQRGLFSKEEDNKLMEICQQYEGLIPWTEVAAKLGNRTDNMCARRWRQLSSATDVMTQYSQRVKKGALKPNTSTRAMRHKRTSIAPEEIEDDLIPNSIKKILQEKHQTLIQQHAVRRKRPRQRVEPFKGPFDQAPTSEAANQQPTAANATPLAPRQQGATPTAPRQQSATPTAPRQQGATPTAPRQQSATPTAPRQQSATPTAPRQQSATPKAPRQQPPAKRSRGSRRADSVQERVLQMSAVQPFPFHEQPLTSNQSSFEQCVYSGGNELLEESPFAPHHGNQSPSSYPYEDRMPSEVFDSGGYSSSLGVVVRALLEMHGSEPSSLGLRSLDDGDQLEQHQLSAIAPPGHRHPPGVAVEGGSSRNGGPSTAPSCSFPPEGGNSRNATLVGVATGQVQVAVEAGVQAGDGRLEQSLGGPLAHGLGGPLAHGLEGPLAHGLGGPSAHGLEGPSAGGPSAQEYEEASDLESDSRTSRMNEILGGLDRATKLVVEECEIPMPPVVQCVNPMYDHGGLASMLWEDDLCLPEGDLSLPEGGMCDMSEADGAVGHTLDPGNGHTLDPGSGQTLDPGSGHTLDPGSGHTLDPGSGHTLDPGSGHTLDPGSGHTLDPGSGHTLDPGSLHCQANVVNSGGALSVIP